MAISIELKPLAQGNIPGQAQLIIKRWKDKSPDNLSISIQRNTDEGYLHGNSGSWSTNEYWFELPELSTVAEGLYSANIGQDLVDPLLENVNASFMVKAKNSMGEMDRGRLVVAPDLLPSSALGSQQNIDSSSTLSTPEVAATPEPEPVAEAETVERMAETEPELPHVAAEVDVSATAAAEPRSSAAANPAAKSKRPAIALIVLLILLILAALAGAAWWLTQKSGLLPAAAAPQAEQTAEAPASPAKASPCALDNMQSGNELAFIQACLKDTTDSQAILSVIQQAKANNHCGIAQRLYANRAQSGDVAIALAYAKEYDPTYYQANECFQAADAETAAYWYSTVLSHDESNSEAQQRLEELEP